MALFRLKAGSHISGGGLRKDEKTGAYDPNNPIPVTFFSHSDPTACVVESDEDLAVWDPGKFEPYTGPKPERLGKELSGIGQSKVEPGSVGLPPPPGPPTPEQIGAAAALKPMTLADYKKKAEELRKQADEYEQAGAAAEKAQAESAKASKRNKASGGSHATPEEEEDEDLESMTVEDLKELAESEGIELHSGMRKDEIIQTIRRNRG